MGDGVVLGNIEQETRESEKKGDDGMGVRMRGRREEEERSIYMY